MLTGLRPARVRHIARLAAVAAVVGSAAFGGAGCGGGAQMRKIDGGTHPDAPTADGASGDRRPTGTVVVGQPCASGGQCATGFCFDGVCCQSDCSGVCQTCAAAGSVGTCLPAEIGTDPRQDCPDQGTASCQHDGQCDGAGACENYPAGVDCQQGGCTGSTLTFAGRCDGLGTCLTTPGQSCVPFSCATSGQCQTTCTVDADCSAGNTCKNGSCGKGPIGASCAAATDCNSGFCAQGICCASACTGTCMSCAIAGSVGTCANVPAGQDPLAQCAPSTTSACGTDGLCDGAGACRLAVSGTVCGTDACTGGTETLAGRCDGVGDCVAGTTEACSPYVCGAGGDCLTTCATTADCAAGYTCSGTICCNAASCALKPLGATCTATTDCASGFCQQGVCCASSCTGTCLSCAIAGKLGTCSPIAAGQAPSPTSQCQAAAAATCGNDGLCNGAGACEVYGTTTTCAPATCAGSTFTPARSCDGAGNCKPVTSSLCDPYGCSATTPACNTTCGTSADCASPNSCAAGSCGKLSNGTACTTAGQCNSGFCAQSFCCSTACTTNCSSCALAGSLGTCISVPAGTDPLGQCSDAGATSCGQNGFCDGTGGCQKYAAGTACAAATCTGSSDTPAASCNGTGTCVIPAASSCSPYVCGAGACKTTCATTADCVSPNLCTAGVCGGGCAGVYCDNFESDTAGAMAAGWTREGGSAGDWQVIADATKAFAQNHALSSTFRLCYASGATGAPWSGATSVTAQVKVLSLGSSGTTTALVCVRYTGGATGDYQCLAIEPGVGAQIQVRSGGAVTSGPVWATTIAVGTYYTVTLSVTAAGALSATLGGTALGTYTPTTAVASGYVAIATQSAEAAFDNLVVTQP
jgi:hypothetical protein